MSPIIVALKALYVTLGGALTDFYADIAGGIPVSDMVRTADLVSCMSRLTIGGGGGKTLYNHNVKIDFQIEGIEEANVCFNVLTDASSELTYESLFSLLKSRGTVVATGYSSSGRTFSRVSATQNAILVGGGEDNNSTIPSTAEITDTVIEI